jgi:hypothetical protein
VGVMRTFLKDDEELKFDWCGDIWFLLSPHPNPPGLEFRAPRIIYQRVAAAPRQLMS